MDVLDAEDYDFSVLVMLVLGAGDGDLAGEPGDHGKNVLGRSVMGLEPLLGGRDQDAVEAGFFSQRVSPVPRTLPLAR